MPPDLSLILPCRNETAFIDACLESIFAQDLDDLSMEVLVVDGASNDGTLEKLHAWAAHEPRLEILPNPDRIVPIALNLGIQAARAPLIVRMDVHCRYPPDYLRKLVASLHASGADNVGGVIRTLPRHDTFHARLVQALSTHRFGVGDAYFRLEGRAGRYVDTVPFGCYRREVFDRIGHFDQRLVRNQDYEFNRRLTRAGGKIWLDPAITLDYFNQPYLWGLLRQAALTGQWNLWMWWVAPWSFRLRHAVPALFVLFMFLGGLISFFFPLLTLPYLAVVVLYFLLALFASVQQALRYRRLSHLFTLPPSFFAYHLAYGFGTLLGLLKLLLGLSPVGRHTRPWPGAPSFRG